MFLYACYNISLTTTLRTMKIALCNADSEDGDMGILPDGSDPYLLQYLYPLTSSDWNNNK